MAKIYRTTDRICVKIEDVTLKFSPLTLDQKSEIQQELLSSMKEVDIAKASRGIMLALKYGLKHIEGVEDSDGKPYQLTFDNLGHLAEECIHDLLNLDISNKLALVSSSFVKGVPKVFTNRDGKPIDGVEVLNQAKDTAGKNA